MKRSSKTLVCLISIAVAIYTSDVLGDEKIIICCDEKEPSSSCQSLDSVGEILHNDLVLELQNGKCILNHSLHFNLVNSVKIRGQGSQYTHISCHHMNAGLVFNQSSNIELRDFTIDSCGVQINHGELLINKTGNASKSIVFMNTTNVVLQGLVVTNSNGYGLMISDCFGSVLLNNTIFENNEVIESELEYTYGGGGLVLTLMPFHHSNIPSHYNIVNCTFQNNSANIYLQKQQILQPQDSEKGGGIKLLVLHNSTNITIDICNCTFQNNHGAYGGGMYVRIRDNTNNCRVRVFKSKFIGNSAEVYGGGGADVGFNFLPKQKVPRKNIIIFSNVLFEGNKGYIGGGASVYASTVEEGIKPKEKNHIDFENCNFNNNSANGGAAIDIRADNALHGGTSFIAGVSFINVNFRSNIPTNNSEPNECAVFLTSEIAINFSGVVIFSDNNATALYSASALLVFTENSIVKFWNNNEEHNGGAVLLAGDSRIQLNNNTYLEFINNTASYGGAICALPIQIHGFTFTDKCFLNTKFHKFNNVTLKFAGNSASIIGKDIFASSLDPCLGQCRLILRNMVNTSEIFLSDCIGHFQFTNEEKQNNIATCPKVLSGPKSTIYPIPGFPYNLQIFQIDEMGNDVGDVFLLNIKLDKTSKAQNVSLGSLTLKNNARFYGEPGKSGNLIIENSSPIIRQMVIKFKLADCPPGFVLNDVSKSCVCSGHLYRGIHSCYNRSALVKPGYWVGYIGSNNSEQTLLTGNCVVRFCNFNEGTHRLPNTSITEEELEEVVCGSKRRGVLCTECADNYTTFYHSPTLECSQKSNCAFGIPLYMISELLPVTIIFLVILIFNVSLTSGAVYCFVFYAQVLDSRFVDAFGTADVNNTATEFILNIFRVAYGSFNLNMFNIEGLSFCIIHNANAMDIFMFQYATILYAVMLVIVTVLALRFNSCYCCVKLGNRCGRRNIRGSIIDGLSAFLVLCYFQCTRITSKILALVTLSGKNETTNMTLPMYLGDSEYFGPGHLPYAIPAVFVLIVVIIPPPCILMLEPVLTKLFSWNFWNTFKVTHYYTKIRTSLIPFLDSFQGCFKDKYRFIAGFYFAYRVAVAATYSSPSVFSFYASLEVILFLIVFIHAILHPHKEPWHNIIEFVILINLLFVNTATVINLAIIQDNVDSSINAMIVVWLQIVAMSIPITYMGVYAAYSIFKQFCCKTVLETSQPLLEKSDDMGFPARLLHSKEHVF